MIRNYFLITWGSMMKNKLFIFINVLGLAVAIACSIVAYFNWEFDAEFNKHHTKADKIYRVSTIREFEGKTTLYGYAPVALGNVVKQNMPDAEKVVRMSWSYSNVKVGDNLFPGGLAYADPDFFDVFSFEMIAGSPSDLKDKSKVFLSDEMALKLFGTVDAVGKPLTQVIGSVLKEYIVGGVFKKQPANSSFVEFAYTHYDNYYEDAKEVNENDWINRNTLFVLINDPARVEAISKQLQPYKENNNKIREDFQISEFKLEPFVGMAQRDSANETYQRDFDIGFDQKGVIIAYVENQGEFEAYRNALLQNKDIVSIAGSKHSIFSALYNDPVKFESKQLEVDIIDVGDDYVKTMGLDIIEGRDFQKNSETDRKESIIITKKFAESFGWDEPIGK